MVELASEGTLQAGKGDALRLMRKASRLRQSLPNKTWSEQNIHPK